MKRPIISIVIPTYSASLKTIEIPLKSIASQKCKREDYEIILADNTNSSSGVIKNIAKKYGTRIMSVKGKPSQACRQVNVGVKAAKGEYIMILDHDISLDTSLIKNFFEIIKNKNAPIDAWYIPYKIIAKNSFLTKIRNFEEFFYTNSIIAAPRIMKKTVFMKTPNHYDIALSAGPADWDLTLQLKLMHVKFGSMQNYFYHHEEHMSIMQFLKKKTIYANGNEIYKEKWKKKNNSIYKSIVKKQYSILYRLVGIFMENGKWKMLLPQLPIYLAFVIIKVAMSLIYLSALSEKT